MGIRLNRLQNYFQQAKPLMVTGQIGGELASAFHMVVNDIRQVSDDRLVLFSSGGELLLHEEEIYKVDPPEGGQHLALMMDGGIELKFTPLPQSFPPPTL